MKKLLIIVPKDSLINSYLQNVSSVYNKVVDSEDTVYYQQTGSFNPIETINYLVTMFMLSDFYFSSNYGDYTFRVRS